VAAASAAAAVAGMAFGGNLGANSTSAGAYPFVNLAYTMGPFAQQAGSGAWTQVCGEVTATVGTDVFEAVVSDNGTGLEAGPLRILNPTGAEMSFGDTVTPHSLTTSTDFTFDYAGPGFPLYLRVKGSLLRHASIKFAILKPGTYTQWQAGDIWDAEFIAFMDGLSLANIRFMDWGATNTSSEVNWTSNTPTNAISFQNLIAGGTKPPYEVMCDLCNRLNVPGWFNTPTRATSAYYSSMATAIYGALNAGLKASTRVSFSNEIWNYNHPFADNARWVEFKDHTRRTATCVGGGATTYTLTAHGIANGSTARHFRTNENKAKRIAFDSSLENGAQTYVEAVDANTIRFHTGSVGGAVVPVATGQVNTLFILDAEAGKTADLNAHYSEHILVVWDAFDAVFGVDGYKRVCEGQAASSGMATARLAVTGMSTRTTEYAIAPYMYERWFHAAIDIASGALTPKVWSNESVTVYAGRYTNNSTPTKQNVVDGAGTGFLAKLAAPISVPAGGSVYTDNGSLGGTNATPYTVSIVVDDGTYLWQMTTHGVTPSASTSTTNVPNSYANMALLHRLYGVPLSVSMLQANITACGAIPVVAYEGGSHFDESGPSAAAAWQAAYLESSEYSAALQYYFSALSAANMQMFCYFVTDALSSASSWKIADSYADTSDLRYTRIAAQNGSTARTTAVAVADAAGTDYTATGSLPRTVYTFSDATLTYQIVDGNDAGNFDISGSLLRQVAENGINYAATSAQAVVVLGGNGTTEDTGTISFSLGVPVWYESDALMALDMTLQASAATLDPTIGGNIGRTAGAGGTFAGGLLDPGGSTQWGAGTALISAPDMTAPALFAVVVKKDDMAATGIELLRFGDSDWVGLNVSGGGNFYWSIYNGAVDTQLVMDWSDNVTAVFWVMTDQANNKVYWGKNQTELNAGGGTTKNTGWMSALTRSVNIFTGTTEKLGSMEAVNRTGMTVTDAKAIVAKMQTLHSIA
jgi:hypothetical protein